MRLRRGFLGLVVLSAVACGGSGFGEIEPAEQAAASTNVTPGEAEGSGSPSPPATPTSSSPSAPAPDAAAPKPDGGSGALPGWPGLPGPLFDGGWIPPLPDLDGGIPWPNTDAGNGPKKDGGFFDGGLFEGGIGIFDGGVFPF